METVTLYEQNYYSWTCPNCKEEHEESDAMSDIVYCESCDTEYESETD